MYLQDCSQLSSKFSALFLFLSFTQLFDPHVTRDVAQNTSTNSFYNEMYSYNENRLMYSYEAKY